MDMPWNDRRGRFSLLRAIASALVVAPGLYLAIAAFGGALGAKPVTEAIHLTGDWALRFLLLTLALTPLRRITSWARWTIVRRMLGLAAFAYALAHLTLYSADEGWQLATVATEIVSRIYLTIGFAVLLGLAALAATSTDAAIRRMGAGWHRLHRIVYPLTALAILHFFMQSKLEVGEATLMMGLYLLLMGWRLAHRAGASLTDARVLLAVAVGAGLATAALEATWYGVATGVPWQAILDANLHFAPWPRPAWWILFIGALFALVPLWPRRSASPRPASALGRR